MSNPKIRPAFSRPLLVAAALALASCHANPQALALDAGVRPGTGGAGATSGGGAGGNGGAGATVGAGATDTGGSGGSDPGGAGAGGVGDDGGGGADDTAAQGLASNGCAGGTCLNPTCQPLGEAAPPGRFVQVGFEAHASYIPNDVIVPTFDDVPDRPYTAADGALFTNYGNGDWTKQILDYLDANNLHFDFFINTDNFCDLNLNPGCVAVVERLVKTQNPGNHTVHHIHMGSDAYDPANMFNSGCRALDPGGKVICEDEITGVESVISIISNGGINHLTRFRAPYGEPFLTPGTATQEIQDVVARFAVHVGWAIDSGDTDRDTTGKAKGAQVFVDNVTRAIGRGPGQGNWGILQLRATYPWTLDQVKILFDPKTGYLEAHKFRIGTVEDVICWKYGRHSWELIAQITGHTPGPN